MTRRDAVQTILEVVARCRQIEPRLIVSYEPGWEKRGNGTSAAYDYGTVHHTASASSLARPFPTQTILRDGRAGLSGPLCNFAGPACTTDAPRLHVMSANPANHAGASRKSGPVPALSLFNPRTLGLEIDYAGTAPMLAGQLYIAKVWSRAVADVVGGGNIEHVRAHAETSVTGKWDPGYASGKTIDMAAFRRDAANITAAGRDELPVGAAEDINEIKQMLRGGMAAPLSNFHWLERNTRQFEVFRSKPEWGGDGTMTLAAPGFWYVIPDLVYLNIYIAKGLCSPDYAECSADEFKHLRDLYLLPMDTGDDKRMAAAVVAALPAASLPATPPINVPMTDQQIAKFAELLAPRIGQEAAAEWSRMARDNDPGTGPTT